MAAEVDGDDPAAPSEALLRQAPEAAPMSADPVQADDGRRAGVAPLVDVQAVRSR